jgi:hypothetical protein
MNKYEIIEKIILVLSIPPAIILYGMMEVLSILPID